MDPTLSTERDERHLLRAVELASEARGRTSPNPLVGAVVVKNGKTIGEGYHAAAGEPHAERVALAACTEDPAGATMYLSLEPCCHEGRTPPCTEAIIEAKIARVVVASDDPTTKAAGRGLGILRDEGLTVDVRNGDASHEARLINQPFRKHARTGRPLVIFKSAMSLDGKVATSTGNSQWISCEESRAMVHSWRAEVDAVAVGVGTVLADDPLLTARPARAGGGAAGGGEGGVAPPGVERQPTRVVFDSEARLPLDGRLAESATEVPLIVVCGVAASRTATEALEAAGAEVVRVSGENEAARSATALEELGERDIQSLLLEGGPHLAGAFLDAGEIDQAHLFVAPMLVGGRQARTAVEGQGVELVGQAESAVATEVKLVGNDVLISTRIKEW